MLFDNSTIWYESHYMISLQCDLDQDLSDGGATLEFREKTYVSLCLRVQNAVSAQPCVGKFRISLVLLNFLHCNFRLLFETP